jgi:hypothetical protein
MPNHVHMIMLVENDERAMRAPAISTVVNQLKPANKSQSLF